jgi:hypothetical protein
MVSGLGSELGFRAWVSRIGRRISLAKRPFIIFCFGLLPQFRQ